MNLEQVRENIACLERQLVDLRRQEVELVGFDRAGLIDQCRRLKLDGKRVEATKLYREKMCCGLRDAHYAIEEL